MIPKNNNSTANPQTATITNPSTVLIIPEIVKNCSKNAIINPIATSLNTLNVALNQSPFLLVCGLNAMSSTNVIPSTMTRPRT